MTLFTECEGCFIFCTVCVCFVLFPIDVTAIKCIISIPCLFICTHTRIQIVGRLLFIKCEFVCLFKHNYSKNYIAVFHIYFPNIDIGTLMLPIVRCLVLL